MRSSRILLILAFIAGIHFAVSAQTVAVTAPRNFEQLVDQSDLIVRGRIVTAILQPHPQYAHIRTVLVTVSVARTLKGSAPKTLVFREFAPAFKGRQQSPYVASQEMVLFLNPTTPVGLRSTAGLEQGRFRIVREGDRELAINGRANVGLFQNMTSSIAAPFKSATESGQQLLAADLEAAIVRLAGGKR